MVLRGRHIAFLVYFTVTGILTLIGILRPDLLVVGVIYGAVLAGPVGVFLGMLVAAAPILFLYPLLLLITWSIAKPLGRVGAVAAALLVTAGVGIAIPYIANRGTWDAIAALRAGDKSVQEPVPIPGTIALLDDRKLHPRQTAPNCTDLCLRLLFNGAVRKVITGVVDSGDQNPLTATKIQAFTIERRDTCEAPDISTHLSWQDEERRPAEIGTPSINRYLARIAAGECLVQNPARIDEAEMFLVDGTIKRAEASNFDKPWRLRLDTVAARRLTLFQQTKDAAIEMDRLTEVTAKPLVIPLLVGLIDGSGLNATSGFRRREVRYNIFGWKSQSAIVDQYRRLFGNAVRLPALVPGADPTEGPSAEQLRALVAKAFDDPNERPAGFSVVGDYMRSLAKQKGAGPEDFALMKRLIVDPRFDAFHDLARNVAVLGPETAVLTAPLMDRLNAAALPKQRETVKAVSWVISNLPPGAAALIAPELVELLREPERRGLAAGAIARISDAGPQYVPQYVAVLESRPRSQTTASSDGDVVIGILRGLCMLGESAADARGPLVAFLREQHAVRKDHPITKLAAEAAFRAGAEEEVEAIYGSDTKEWKFIQRRWQQPERGTPRPCRY